MASSSSSVNASYGFVLLLLISNGNPFTANAPLRSDAGGGLGSLGSILTKVFPDGFEMEDALLLLVLFLMYKETGDKDLLIIMGAMFLL